MTAFNRGLWLSFVLLCSVHELSPRLSGALSTEAVVADVVILHTSGPVCLFCEVVYVQSQARMSLCVASVAFCSGPGTSVVAPHMSTPWCTGQSWHLVCTI